jgi:hypothetical protein
LARVLRAQVEFAVPSPVKSARVSLAPFGWASVRCSSECNYEDRGSFFLFVRVGRQWRLADNFSESRANTVFFCAYAPARAIRALFGANCPPQRDVHAQLASGATARALVAANGSPFITGPCVSRLNDNWAGGEVNPQDPYLEYFKRSEGRWRHAWGPPYAKESAPSRALLLSLDSCVLSGLHEG